MEVNVRTVSRGQDELVGKFKMAAGDVISIREQVLEHTYILTGIERELVRFCVDFGWKGRNKLYFCLILLLLLRLFKCEFFNSFIFI